jgi:hypothetical protein
VHPSLIEEADKYREEFKKRFGFDIPRTTVTKQMAEVFGKMVEFNGMPQIKSHDSIFGNKKKKTMTCDWSFEL